MPLAHANVAHANLRWPRELNALQLQKTPANQENAFVNLTTHTLQMLTTQPKKKRAANKMYLVVL